MNLRDSKGKFKKGNKGFWLGKRRSNETKRKISINRRGKAVGKENPFYGKKHNRETKKKMSKIKKRLYRENKIMVWNKGLNYSGMSNKNHCEETKIKIRDALMGRLRPEMSLEHHPNWQGGKSFEPYPIEFNRQLKQKIHKRDNFTCQKCGLVEKQLGYELSTHHIDFNKNNNSSENLISLCKNCHTKLHWEVKNHEQHTLVLNDINN